MSNQTISKQERREPDYNKKKQLTTTQEEKKLIKEAMNKARQKNKSKDQASSYSNPSKTLSEGLEQQERSTGNTNPCLPHNHSAGGFI